MRNRTHDLLLCSQEIILAAVLNDFQLHGNDIDKLDCLQRLVSYEASSSPHAQTKAITLCLWFSDEKSISLPGNK